MRLLFLAACVTISSFSHSQERVNAELPKIGPEILGELKNAKGWMFNPEGQWISRENRIPNSVEARFAEVLDYQTYKRGADNFSDLQFRKIRMKNSDYLIMIKKFYSGFYEYPNLKEGWNDSYAVGYVLFELKDSSAFHSLKNGEINLIKLKPLYRGEASIKNEDIITSVENDIAASEFYKTGKDNDIYDKRYDSYFAFHIAPYKEKNIVQFNLYFYTRYKDKHSHPSAYFTAGYEAKFNDVAGTDQLFKTCYFETDYKSFFDFLPIEK